MIQELYVYIFLNGEWVPCGLLTYSEEGRFSHAGFAYGTKYLKRDDRISIDPVSLPLVEGKTFQTEEGMPLFNGIRDAGPDKWGRYLLDKRFARGVSEIEYVAALGPDRVGALAFGPDPENGPRKYNSAGFEPYTLKRLSLEDCLEGVEDAVKNESTEKLKEYLNYGPSLGGARPKATVDWKKRPHIAKFLLSSDETNEPLIEYATMSLAKKCGLNVPRVDYTEVIGKGVYLIERFDRDEKQSPIPFISGLTATGLAENDYFDWSYFKLCDAIKKLSPEPEEDLKELFARLVYNICVYNNDDHMRNFGFLSAGGGRWSLSPHYDVVPRIIYSNTYALAMPFGAEGKKASLGNALSRCEEFALERPAAQKIVDRIIDGVADWKKQFQTAGVPSKDIVKLEHSFALKE